MSRMVERYRKMIASFYEHRNVGGLILFPVDALIKKGLLCMK